MDGFLDDLHRQFIAQIFESHAAGTIDLQVAVQLAVVARFYERIGDHAVNIGQRVTYIATGRLPDLEAERALAGSRGPAGSRRRCDVTALLVATGAVLVFLIGWAVGRRAAPEGDARLPAREVPTGDLQSPMCSPGTRPASWSATPRQGAVPQRRRTPTRRARIPVFLLDDAIERHLSRGGSGTVERTTVVEFYGPPKLSST